MRRLTLVSALIAGLFAAAPAAAQLASGLLEEGQIFYAGAKVEWAKVNLPRTLQILGVTTGSGRFVLDGQNQVEGWGTGGGFGLVMPPGKVDLGRNLRIEVSGGVFSAESESRTSVRAGDVLSISAPDGSMSFMGAFPSDGRLQTSLDYDTWNVDLLVRTDFGDPEGVVVSPFVGTTYTREDRWDRLRGDFAQPQNRPGNFFIDQEMNTDYAGVVLGSSLYLPVGPALLSLTGRADLTGADVEGTTKLSGTTAPTIRAKDKDFAFSANLGGSAGIEIPIGPLRIAAEGFGSWRSWAPQASYAEPFGGSSPFRLTGDTLWAWGGRARVEIVF